MTLRFLLFFLLISAGSSGQPYRIIDRNAIGWYVYNGDHKLSKRWELHTEYQWRRVALIRSWQQSLARLGLKYKLTDQVKLAGGYTFFTTYPYGDFPVADAGVPTLENRTHEDIQLSATAGIVKLDHRFRLEQRWLGIGADLNPRHIEQWEYQNRARYQFSGTIPLEGTSIDDGEQNVFNQNRLSGGLGYQLSAEC